MSQAESSPWALYSQPPPGLDEDPKSGIGMAGRTAEMAPSLANMSYSFVSYSTEMILQKLQ